jgi:LacI family transcriptional regulator
LTKARKNTGGSHIGSEHPKATIMIEKICQRSGLAKSTVYAALANTGRLSEPTRLRVLKVARDIGYRPNSAAKAIASGQFNAIAYLCSGDSGSRFSVRMTSGVYNAALASGKHITLARGDRVKLAEFVIVPRVLREAMCDGLLVDYASEVPADILHAIFESRLPTIWLNSKLDSDCVYPLEFDAGRHLGQLVVAAGHQRVAYSHAVWNTADRPETAWHYSLRDRRDGVLSALRQARVSVLPGASLQPAETRLASYPDYVRAGIELLSRPEVPTAVVCYSSLEATALGAAAHILGLSVPKDLSILAFADEPTYILDRRVTAAMIPEEEVGFQGVQLLNQLIVHRDKPLAPQAIPFTFDTGETLAPPKRA